MKTVRSVTATKIVTGSGPPPGATAVPLVSVVLEDAVGCLRNVHGNVVCSMQLDSAKGSIYITIQCPCAESRTRCLLCVAYVASKLV